MRALFVESERNSPFVRSVRRVGGVNGKFSGKCQSILVMSNLFFARTTKFLQQIADVFWRYLTILKAAKTYAWSWLHLLMLGCISSMPPIIWKGGGPLIFTCYERLSAVTRAVAVGNYPMHLAHSKSPPSIITLKPLSCFDITMQRGCNILISFMVLDSENAISRASFVQVPVIVRQDVK